MDTLRRGIFVWIIALSVISIAASCFPAGAQKDKKPTSPPLPLLTRTTQRHESYRFAYGGTVTIAGAPAGSVTIEGWPRSEVDVSADIELHASTTEDLDRLAPLNGFVVDQDSNHLRVITTGTHDRAFMKRAAKNFPKALMGLPWRIDYRIKVPLSTDLDVNSGLGPVRLSGIEGILRLNAIESNADLSLAGGDASIIVQRGTVNIDIPIRSWRGLGARVQLASGTLNVALLPGFNSDIDADVLRLGEVKNFYPNLEPRYRNSITAHSIKVRAGSGGAMLSFTVGDGLIQIKQIGSQ